VRAAVVANRAEACRAFNLLIQEVADVNTAVFSAKEPVRDTGTLDVLTLVAGCILRVRCLGGPLAIVQATVKALPLVDPELEVTLVSFSIATECRLCLLILELINDLAIRDVAHLVVLLHDQSFAVADAIFSIRHHGITCVVRLANIAIYPLPSFGAFALLPLSWKPVLAFWKGSTQWLAAVFSAKTRRAGALAAAASTVGELKTREVVKVAVETRRAIGRPVAVDGEIGIGGEEVLCSDE
jgi:hypothetical protein